MFWIGLVIGSMLIGSPLGFMVAAFCAAAKSGNEHLEIQYQQKENT